MKVVYKYGTGEKIPENAKYLCTQVETMQNTYPELEGMPVVTKNHIVWHYYELILKEKNETE